MKILFPSPIFLAGLQEERRPLIEKGVSIILSKARIDPTYCSVPQVFVSSLISLHIRQQEAGNKVFHNRQDSADNSLNL